MPRATRKPKPTSKSSTTISTTPVMPSDGPGPIVNPATTPSSVPSQEASTPLATVSNTVHSKKAKATRTTAPVPKDPLKTKISSRQQVPVETSLTTAPADSNDASVLLARLAEREAEIDRLRKASQSMAQDTKPKEIKRPNGAITNLQKAMGLENDRALYMSCRSTVNDVLAHAGIPHDIDWRRQDFIALGKVASVARSRNKQLQLYEANWAPMEIMKTILKNKRNYRTKIGRGLEGTDYDNQDLPDHEQQAAGSSSTSTTNSGHGNGANDEGFSDSDENGSGADEDSAGAGSAGRKRKATRSGGSGEKGKQRRV